MMSWQARSYIEELEHWKGRCKELERERGRAADALQAATAEAKAVNEREQAGAHTDRTLTAPMTHPRHTHTAHPHRTHPPHTPTPHTHTASPHRMPTPHAHTAPTHHKHTAACASAPPHTPRLSPSPCARC
jgi:hypothetical protein